MVPGMAATEETQVGLPDPWRYGRGGSHPLLDLAVGDGAESALVEALRERLDRRADAEVYEALDLAPDRLTYTRLWQGLCAAAEGREGSGDTVVTEIFALPVVIVTGARRAGRLPGVLRDVDAVGSVLQRAGALGASRSFGFSNALASLATLERLPPSTVREWQRGAAPLAAPRAIAPEPVDVRPGEEAHLRFLLGAAVSPATAPSVAETAAHVGAWGMALARELRAQLAGPEIDVLPLARPPAGILRAAYRGRRAQLDVALNLFLSNTVRRIRTITGDPVAILSAHSLEAGAGELRISLGSPFDEGLTEGFRLPLHPLDDPARVSAELEALLEACRVTDIRRVRRLLPDDIGGGARFPGAKFVAALDRPG